MALATRHVDDPAPALPMLPGMRVRREADAAAMASLQGRSHREVAQRFAHGHRAYVALLHGRPAAWGWVATRAAEIGELATTFGVPRGERYLWNFVTLPDHRRLGIYPRLVDAIVRAEATEADRFWIAYAPENHASAAGVRKAGFTAVAELSFDGAGRPALADLVPGGAAAAASFLGVPPASEPLSRCWRCVRLSEPTSHTCRTGGCACDYQVAASGCVAPA